MKVKGKRTTLWGLLVLAVLGLFGSSCRRIMDSDKVVGGEKMYGCPVDRYNVKDSVPDPDKDKETLEVGKDSTAIDK